MAEVIGLAASVASLVQIAGQITRLSYSYASDIKNASKTQKQYLQEVSAFTDVPFRAEDAIQEVETSGLVQPRPASVSDSIIDDCRNQLSSIQAKLEKHLRSYVWPFQERELRKHIDTLHIFRGIFADFVSANVLILTNATYRKVEASVQVQERQQLLSLLPKADDFAKSRPLALPGTGKWFLSSLAYQEWCDDLPLMLWCYGAPGVGKSLLASIAIDDLLEKVAGNCLTVIYYFCDFAAREQQQQQLTILQSLVRQIVERGDAKIISVLKDYLSDTHRLRNHKELSIILAKAFSLLDSPYLVIDALDELNNPEGLLSHLQSFIDAGCKVLVTSRDILRSTAKTARNMEVETAFEDLELYIMNRFQESEFNDEIDECRGLISTVASKSNNIFLLAKLFVDQLLELTTIKQMLYNRIDSQPAPKRELAHRLIHWITNAERRMKIDEVLHAFAVEEGSDEIDPENLMNADRLLRLCVGLVTLDRKNGTLGLVHTTAYEFFRNKTAQSQETQIDMAKTCMLYLSTKPLTQGPCEDVGEMEARLQAMPFLAYASHFWGRHIRNQDIEKILLNQILTVLKDVNLLLAGFQALQHREELNDQEISTAFFKSIPTVQEPLHVAAYWNLVLTMLALLEDNADSSPTDSQKWTPLHWACSNGHSTVVEVLIGNGADVNTQDSQGWTPLFWAAFVGSHKTVQLLLANNANHLVRSSLGWTALHWAISRGEISIVEALLEHHARYLAEKEHRPKLSLRDLKVSDACEFAASDNLIPLEFAAETGDSRLFDVLVRHLATKDSKPGDQNFNKIWSEEKFDTPVSNPWRTTTKAEVIYGAERCIPTSFEISWSSQTEPVDWKSRLLKSAIRDSKLSAVRLLLAIGADVNDNDINSVSPLHIAAFRTDPRFAQVLLENEADPELLDGKGQTALHQAIINGFTDTVTALLDGGARIDRRVTKSRLRVLTRGHLDGFKRESITPLIIACGIQLSSKNDEDIASQMIRLLLSRGANPLLQDDRGMSALHYAALNPKLSIIVMLLEWGSRVDLVNKKGETPLHLLAKHLTEGCHLQELGKIVEAFVQASADGIRLLGAVPEPSKWSGLETSKLPKKRESSDTSDESNTDDKPKSLHEESTPVILALKSKSWKLFQLFLERGAEMPKDLPLQSILQDAVRSFNPTVVKILASHRPSLTPNEGIVITLVEATVPIIGNLPSEEKKPFDDFKSILTSLISLGADVNDICPESGDTSILIASKKMDSKFIIQEILDAGADPYRQNLHGLDSFLVAVLHKNYASLCCLVANAIKAVKSDHWAGGFASVWRQDSDITNALCECLKISDLVDQRNRHGRTLLHFAAEAGNSILIDQLLIQDAHVDIADDKGWLPVHYAGFSGHTDAVKLLLPISKPTQATNIETSHEGDFHLQETVTRFDVTISDWIQTVLEKTNEAEETMLHVAIETHNTALVSHLLHLGADVKIPVPCRRSYRHTELLLYTAAERGFEDIVSLLISFGTDVEASQMWYIYNDDRPPESYGWRPIHMAALKGHIHVVEMLIHAKANVCATTTKWNSDHTKPTLLYQGSEWAGQPLHLATMMGHIDIVRILLENGADVHASTGSDGKFDIVCPGHGPTALHIALDTNTFYSRNGNPLDRNRLRIAQMLVERGAKVDGVADHLRLQDVLRFKGHEGLWDTLRAGISDNGRLT